MRGLGNSVHLNPRHSTLGTDLAGRWQQKLQGNCTHNASQEIAHKHHVYAGQLNTIDAYDFSTDLKTGALERAIVRQFGNKEGAQGVFVDGNSQEMIGRHFDCRSRKQSWNTSCGV